MAGLTEQALSTPSVPGFQLDRLIGEGGFGQVWRAMRPDGSLVAIKVLHFELVSSNDAMTRFQREVAAVQRLQHPNVVRAFEHGALPDGRPYMVMEYLDGASLREAIRERGVFPPDEVIAIFGPLCEALTMAHAASLVHRDIKASNIVLLRGDNNEPRPVLLDFGLVKLIDDIGPGLTSSRTMLGTPTAMAPEQMRGEAVDARTDVYALGLLAFHMLTGQPAFTAGGGAIKSYLQLHGPRPRPSAKIDIDPAIDIPVMKALSATPAERYSSANELYEALKAAVFASSRRNSGVIALPPVEVERSPETTLVTPPAASSEVTVVVIYVEADRAVVTRVQTIARQLGMTIAISAPDSVLAVHARMGCDVAQLIADLQGLSGKLAVGISRASIHDDEADGPALDVEGWAPYPLPDGLWVDPALQDPC